MLKQLSKVGDGKEKATIIGTEGPDKKQHHPILERHAIPSGRRIFGKNFIFHQDNDPKRTSKLCKNYIQSKEEQCVLKIMEWPAQSPDLSRIELVWDELDRRVRACCPGSAKQLFQILKNEWAKLPAAYFQKLLKRIPRICAAVLKANGGYFDETKV